MFKHDVCPSRATKRQKQVVLDFSISQNNKVCVSITAPLSLYSFGCVYVPCVFVSKGPKTALQDPVQGKPVPLIKRTPST